MRGVHFDDVVTGIQRAQRCFAPVRDDCADLTAIERVRHGRCLACGHRARGNGLPRRLAMFCVRCIERAITVPRRAAGAFASRVADLDCGYRALAADEVVDASVLRDVRICIDSGAVIRLAPAFLDRRFLAENDARAAHRELAQMHKVKVGRSAVVRRVLAHR